jgi:O-antigen/teichoic acid export membrane protein
VIQALYRIIASPHYHILSRMRRLFARNLLFMLGINLLIKPIWIFVIDRTVQNRVGYADFGTYTALLNLAIIFQILIDFGLNSYNTRTISSHPERFPGQFPLLVTARLLLIGLYAGVVLAIGVLCGYRGRELGLLGGVIMLQSAVILLLFVRSNVAALQRYRLDGLLSVLDRFLMILGCGALLLLPATFFTFRIEYFIGAQIACYALAIGTGLFILRKIAPMPRFLHFRLKPVWGIIREGAPYALLAFLMATYMRSDMLLVERLFGANGKVEAGRYVAAYRLLDVANMFSIMIAGVLMPLFGRMLAEQQPVAPIIRLCTNLLLPFSFLAAAGCWLAGTEIMELLYHHHDPYNGLLLALLMSSFPAYSIMYIYSTLLTADGHIALLNRLSAIGMVINVGLNLLLIPEYGGLGAAVSTGLTQWVLAFCFIYAATRRNNLPIIPRWIAAHIAYILIVIMMATLLPYAPLAWQVRIILLSVTGLVLIVAFRFISLKSVKQLLMLK